MNPRLPRIVSLFSIHNSGAAVSYIAASILDQMTRRGVDSQLWVPTSDFSAQRSFIRNAVPPILKGLAYRTLGHDKLVSLAERRFLSALRPGDVAYLWPGPRPDFYQKARDRGAIVVRESINCPIATTVAILRREAEKMGMESSDGLQAIIDAERRQFEASDFLFAPSPLVVESLRAEGVPNEKILPASYGWDPERIARACAPRRSARGDEIRFLFVGTICLRKGVHRLVDAWKRAGSPGRLILAGEIDLNFPKHFIEALNDPTIELPGYTSNIGPIFQSADVFVFPSFEEGGPMVTYEAMGAALPVITTPMGAGAIARDGEGAIILPPDDPQAWADAIRRLAADSDLRAEMGKQSAARASLFTWEKCAEIRIDLLREALAGRQSGHAAGEASPQARPCRDSWDHPAAVHDGFPE